MKHVTLIRLPLILAMWIVLAGGAAAARDTRTVAPATLARILSAPRVTPTVGAPHGDVTMVEYFDYNCPVCRELEPRLRELLGADPAVRLVRKDWAIFGEGSVCAAYASFAAAREGRYPAAHDAQIASSRRIGSKTDVLEVRGNLPLGTRSDARPRLGNGLLKSSTGPDLNRGAGYHRQGWRFRESTS